MHSFRKMTGKIVKTVAFLALILLINAVMQYALVPSSYMRNNFHNVKENQYDDIFIGTSHGFVGIAPEKVDEVTGRNSTNICMASEFLADSYYIVKEACRNQKPKRIIYELDPGYWVTENNTGNDDVFIYNNMPWSGVKVQYGLDKLGEKDFRASLFLWHYYRSNVGNIKKIMTQKGTALYKNYLPDIPVDTNEYYKGEGFLCHPRGAGENKVNKNIVLWEEDKIRGSSQKYLKKLIKYCEEENIELTVIILPISSETLAMYPEYFKEAYDYYDKLIESYGLKYYNFNRMDDPAIDRSFEAFYDYDGHMYLDAAEQFSLVLGKYLKKE